MRFKEFLAEIKNSMKQYDSAGLIDELSVYGWVVDGLNKLGNLPTIKIEKVLEIKNKKTALPENFKSLYMALKCEPFKYQCDEKTQPILQSSSFWRTLESSSLEWDKCDPCCVTEKEGYIIENIYFDPQTLAKVFYKEPTLLKLTPHIQRESCDKECINKKAYDSKYEINIQNKTLYANFNKGSIFIVYNGYPSDEEDFVMIPDEIWVKDYLSYFVKRRVIEDLLTNSDNQSNEISLYQLFATNEQQSFANAKTQLKFQNINFNLDNYKKSIRKDFETFNFGFQGGQVRYNNRIGLIVV